MDATITYKEMAVLVANPPFIAPHPNLTSLHKLQCYIHCALQCLSCPQSNILGWVGLIMARPMYAFLTMTPFQLSTDLGLLAIYYPPPVPIVDSQGALVLEAAGQPTFFA
jgi:hypothetical protein